MLATALCYRIGLDMFERAGQGPDFEAVKPICDIQTQHVVAGYRVDLALIGPCIKVAIECDGHDFHEKTKEQAARDKARDRAITAEGYTLLRFTGSEIWANALACASECLSIASRQLSDAAEAAWEARRDAQP
jgi:very-short-patch-repair endonuclease